MPPLRCLGRCDRVTTASRTELGDHPCVHVVLTRDAFSFAGRARHFLEGRIERNILATVLEDVLGGHFDEPGQLLAYAIDAREEVVAAAFRTPPRFMLASDFDRPGADALLDLWLAEDPELPGVAGPPATTSAIAGAWASRTGGRTRASMQMALHDLEEVHDPPRPAPGRLREPSVDERPLMIVWLGEFAREAGAPVAPPAPIVDARLRDRLVFVWDDGDPVCLVGLNHPVAGVVRIGPVFTPPEYRRHGYASSAVAAVSRQALERGARRCILYTDLLNPTSNKIYAEVGYRRVADWEELAFEPREAPLGDNPLPKGTPTPPI